MFENECEVQRLDLYIYDIATKSLGDSCKRYIAAY